MAPDSTDSAAATAASRTQRFCIDDLRYKQYPGPQQVELGVKIEIPGSFFTAMGGLWRWRDRGAGRRRRPSTPVRLSAGAPLAPSAPAHPSTTVLGRHPAHPSAGPWPAPRVPAPRFSAPVPSTPGVLSALWADGSRDAVRAACCAGSVCCSLGVCSPNVGKVAELLL